MCRTLELLNKRTGKCVGTCTFQFDPLKIKQCPIQCSRCFGRMLYTPEEENVCSFFKSDNSYIWGEKNLNGPIRQRKKRHEGHRRERESCKSYRKLYGEMECA